jgi:hypothetical protein
MPVHARRKEMLNMPIAIRAALCGISVAASLVAATAFADGSALGGVTPSQVRLQFADCGFVVDVGRARPDNPIVVVRDRASRFSQERVLIAIVYLDLSAAAIAHQHAHARAEDLDGTQPYSMDQGPRLLTGYGASVWRQNVALVSSTLETLHSQYAYDTQTDESREGRPELVRLGFARSAGMPTVDADFVDCMEQLPTPVLPLVPDLLLPTHSAPGQPF